MEIHPREQQTELAARELGSFLIELQEKHQLTTGEYLRVVNNECSATIARIARMAIRYERHGSGDKPGGVA